MPIKNPAHKAILKGFKKMAKDSRKTVQWGMNDAAKLYKKQLPDMLRERYTIKKAAANKRIKVQKAKIKDLSAKVEVYKINSEQGESTPASLFSFSKPVYDKKKKGVRAQIIKGKKVLIKGAFIRQIEGNSVIMRRKGFPDQKAPYPTTGIHGVSPGAMLEEMQGKNEAKIDQIIESRAKEVLGEILK